MDAQESGTEGRRDTQQQIATRSLASGVKQRDSKLSPTKPQKTQSQSQQQAGDSPQQQKSKVVCACHVGSSETALFSVDLPCDPASTSLWAAKGLRAVFA